MILLITAFNLAIYIFVALYNNLTIKIATTTVPLLSSGGTIEVYNFTSDQIVSEKRFADYWDYPKIFCQVWSDNQFDSNTVVETEPPGYRPETCSYQKKSKIDQEIEKFRILNIVAVVTSSVELLITIALVWNSHRDKTYLSNTKWYVFYITTIPILSLFSYLVIITSMAEISFSINTNIIFDRGILIMNLFITVAGSYAIIGSLIYKVYHIFMNHNVAPVK